MSQKSVGIIGFGALGMLFASILRDNGAEIVILADEQRAERIRQNGAVINGVQTFFDVLTRKERRPLDLILFATKAGGLEAAAETAAPFISDDTLLVSVLNGISSELFLECRFGKEKVILCTAQGMDAVREGNQLNFHHPGTLVIGEREPGPISERVSSLESWLKAHGVKATAVPDMARRQWGKLMLNVGVNQVVMLYEGDYGTVQQPGDARELMIAAMREVQQLAALEGFPLTDAELDEWVALIDTLAPEKKPSMRQDAEAHRFSEVELFAGTIIREAERFHLDVPVNREIYRRVREIESTY